MTLTHKPYRPIILTVPTKTPAQEYYKCLVTLALADLTRRGFSETVAEKFLEQRCEVEFVTLLDVPSGPMFESQHEHLELWVQVLKHAKQKLLPEPQC